MYVYPQNHVHIGLCEIEWCMNLLLLCMCICRAVEQFVARFPQYLNHQKDDGYSPLHIAVANNHPDIAEFLAQQVSFIEHVSYTLVNVHLSLQRYLFGRREYNRIVRCP